MVKKEFPALVVTYHIRTLPLVVHVDLQRQKPSTGSARSNESDDKDDAYIVVRKRQTKTKPTLAF
jgi:hypothetical protein